MNASLFVSSPRIDRAFRIAAKIICLLLVDANIILITVTLVRFTLPLAGVALLEACNFATLSPLYSTPIVLLATALLLLRRRRTPVAKPRLQSPAIHKTLAENPSLAPVC